MLQVYVLLIRNWLFLSNINENRWYYIINRGLEFRHSTCNASKIRRKVGDGNVLRKNLNIKLSVILVSRQKRGVEFRYSRWAPAFGEK